MTEPNRATRMPIHPISVSRQRLGRILVGCLLAASASAAWAVDMDVLVNDVKRRTEAEPYCPDLVKKKGTLAPLEDYRKGLCLMYGVEGDPQPVKALALLRLAADAGLTQAQLALADTLQKGKVNDQIEALVWYRRADQGGEPRASMQYERLVRRIDAFLVPGSDSTIPDPPPGTIVDPTNAEMQKLYRDGYHCHIMAFGQKWCHNITD